MSNASPSSNLRPTKRPRLSLPKIRPSTRQTDISYINAIHNSRRVTVISTRRDRKKATSTEEAAPLASCEDNSEALQAQDDPSASILFEPDSMNSDETNTPSTTQKQKRKRENTVKVFTYFNSVVYSV
jgi:hypothetical protein